MRICAGAIAAQASPYERLSAEEGQPFDDDAFPSAPRAEDNARYERPAIRAIAGDVRGLDVLDFGCGGEHTAWLVENGARVVEFDARGSDLHEGLPVQKESVDLVFSSLSLHYVREWEPLLREFRRVTRPSGALVFSTHHPCRGLHDGLGVDYFSTGLVIEEQARFWRRPLQAIVSAVVDTGWRIERLVEPRIAEAVDPWFLIVRAAR